MKRLAILASGFSIKIEIGLERTQYAPLMQQGYIQEGLFVNIRTLIKLSTAANGARIVCKGELSVKIKPITANTRAKDKYVKVCMINTFRG